MQDLYENFDTMVQDAIEVKDLSLTVTSAMKGCMAESEEAYHLLPALEVLGQKTTALYEKMEDMSTQLLQQNLRADHDSV